MALNEVRDYIKKNVSKCVVSLSGGLDSTILTHLLVDALGKDNVIAVSYFYNQRHDIELRRAKKTCEILGVKHFVQNIDFLGDIVKNISAMVKGDVKTPTMVDVLGDPQPVTYVPFRNMILSSLTAAYTESVGFDGIALGIQAMDSYAYWDTSIDFANKIQDVVSLNRKCQIKYITPFVSFNKAQEIKLALELGVDLANTWTCYNPQENELACGVCPSCMERLKAFRDLGIVDPVKYIKNPT